MERERRAREAMARAEAESAYVAYAADGDASDEASESTKRAALENYDEDAAAGGDWEPDGLDDGDEEEEEVIDLDDE
jgi:hypothetical protein